MDQEKQEFVLTEVASEPVPSLLRGFSAPVKMEVQGQTDDHLTFLLAHDTGLTTHLLCAQRACLFQSPAVLLHNLCCAMSRQTVLIKMQCGVVLRGLYQASEI